MKGGKRADREWLYFQPFIFYPLVIVGLGVWAFIRESYQTGRLVWLALAAMAGLLIWTMIEYWMHRGILHKFKHSRWLGFMPWAHREHHKKPRELFFMFVPVWFSLPISVLILLTLYLLIQNWALALATMAGIWVGYLFYEFVHYSAHCRQPRWRLMRYLKTYHLLHHHTTEDFWFAVTTPFTDKLFGTYKRQKTR